MALFLLGLVRLAGSGHGDTEQAGEGVALAESRTLCHRCISLVVLLVTGFGTLPPCHRTDLRTEECACALREAERTDLATDNATLWILARTGNLVAECDVVVRQSEHDRHFLPLGILERDIIGMVAQTGTRMLEYFPVPVNRTVSQFRRHQVQRVLLRLFLEGQALGKVAEIGFET